MVTDVGVFSFGQGAVALLKDLLRLDWRLRINAVDALDHQYFKMAPFPMQPHEIPVYEESHELDRRKFHDRKANLPPAPKGGTVGIGPDAHGATAGFNTSDAYNRNGANGGGRYRDDRRSGWPRDRGPPSRHPPQRDDPDRGPAPPRNRGAPRGADVDTYIPSYRGPEEDGGRRRDDRGRDDRRPRPPRDDRFQDRDRDPRDRDRDRPPRSRSRSPNHDRARERDRERERVDLYRR